MSITDQSTEFSRSLEANHKRNTLLVILDAVWFGFGFAVFSPFTILPGFVRHFTANPILINSVVAIFCAGLFGPQIFSCWIYDARPDKLRPYVLWGFLYRTFMLALIPIAAVSGRFPQAVVPIFLVFYFLASSAWGMSTLLWHELLGRWLDERKRNMVIGVRFFAEQSATLASGFAIVWVMNRLVFPKNYTAIFAAGAFCWWMCQIALMLTRETVYPIAHKPMSFGAFCGKLSAILRRDSSFRWFVIFLILASAHTMSAGLYTTFSMDRLYPDAGEMVRDRWASMCNLIMGASFAAGSLANGFISRQRGNRPGLFLSAICCVLSAVNACIAPDAFWFSLTFVFSGMTLGFFLVSLVNVLLVFSPPLERLRYIAIANTTRGIFSFIFPLAGGVVAQWLGARACFVGTAIFCFISAFVILFKVRRAEDGGLL